MKERRSVLELLFGWLAAAGLLIFMGASLSREPIVAGFDFVAYGWMAVGLAFLIGGAAASRWCRRRRLAAAVNGKGGEHAN